MASNNKNKNNKIISLLYHDVTDNRSSTGFQSKSSEKYTTTQRDFFEHLKVIQNINGLKSYSGMRDYEKETDIVLFTFDDGGKSSLYIADQLNLYDVKGLFFISTQYIGEKKFLNKNEIKHLANCGHTIGSHSHTHSREMYLFNKHDSQREVGLSKKILEDIIGQNVSTFSVPYGQTSKNLYKSVYNAGYEYVFNSEPALYIKYRYNLGIIGRVSITSKIKNKEFKLFAEGKNFRREYYKRIMKNLVEGCIIKLASVGWNGFKGISISRSINTS